MLCSTLYGKDAEWCWPCPQMLDLAESSGLLQVLAVRRVGGRRHRRLPANEERRADVHALRVKDRVLVSFKNLSGATCICIKSFCMQAFCMQAFCMQAFCMQPFCMQAFCLQAFCIQAFCLQAFLRHPFCLKSFRLQGFCL